MGCCGWLHEARPVLLAILWLYTPPGLVAFFVAIYTPGLVTWGDWLPGSGRVWLVAGASRPRAQTRMGIRPDPPSPALLLPPLC